MNEVSDDHHWHDLAALHDIPDGQMSAHEVNGFYVALYNVGGEIFATDNICTHGEALLTDGFLDGNMVECPLHGGQFDVCNGKALCAPAEAALQIYATRVTNGRVQVLLPSASN